MTTPGASPATPGPVLTRRPVKRHAGPVTSRRVPQQARPRRDLPPLPPLPAWAHDLPEPATYLRAGWRKLHDGVNDGQDRVLVGVVVIGAWYALTAQPWMPDLVTAAAWLTALTYGAVVLRLCQTGAAPWQWTTRRAGAVLGVVAVLGGLWLASGALLLAFLLSLGAAQAFAHRPSIENSPEWYGAPLLEALTTANFIPRDAWLSYVSSEPRPGAAIQQVKVSVVTGAKQYRRPLGVTAEKVRPALRSIEAALPGLKVGQLHISHDDDDDASVITFTVTPPARRDVVSATMPERWDYNTPLPIGTNRVGQPVTRRTWGCHAGFVGMTGSGKTWFGRYEVAHALLDPAVRVFLIDGKGDDADWTAMHPLCERVVVGSNVTAGRRALAVLEHIDELSESRKGDPEASGVVVVIDEWYRLMLEVKRQDSKLAADLDSLLTGLHATARSRRIRFLTFWQAGTKDYISKAMRVNIGQRFIGQTESTAEVRYFLEQVPDHLPKASGQFIAKDEGMTPVLVSVPALESAAFAAVCDRAARLRAGLIEAPADPLTVAVHGLLAVEAMKPSVLLGMLPDDLRPATAQALGYALRRMPGVEAVTLGGHKHYRATPVAAPSTPTEPPTYGASEADLSVTGTKPRGSEVAP